MLEAKLKELDISLSFLCIEKDDLLAHLLKDRGLTLNDIAELERQKQEDKRLCPWQAYPTSNPKFDDSDIRSKIGIGWYAFAGGHFSCNSKAYPNCQGVVGIINDDPNAPKGNRVKIVLRHNEKLAWCNNDNIRTNVTNDDNGKINTRRLLEFGEAKDIEFPAAQFAYNYVFDGVKRGEAYIPSLIELKNLGIYSRIIEQALYEIGGSFDYDNCWSSSERTYYSAWYLHKGHIDHCRKNENNCACCLLAY